MTTRIYAHSVFGKHETPQGHVEQPGRYAVVEEVLRAPELAMLDWQEAPMAEWESLSLGHDPAQVSSIRQAASIEQGMVQLDPDTFAGPHSLEASRRAVGGAMAAVDAVVAGDADNAFVIARPPGHHATPTVAMGFCLFNSVAIAARHARKVPGLTRVAVVDFDVHHGNGTQDIFWEDENCFFASSHEWPQYPGTGLESERGAFDNISNQRLQSGSDGDAFRRAWGEHLLPALSDFQPEMILVSAGFDAHAADSVGGLNLTGDDFRWITRELLAIADDKCGGRLVSLLEGGYDLPALGASARVHVETLAQKAL